MVGRTFKRVFSTVEFLSVCAGLHPAPRPLSHGPGWLVVSTQMIQTRFWLRVGENPTTPSVSHLLRFRCVTAQISRGFCEFSSANVNARHIRLHTRRDNPEQCFSGDSATFRTEVCPDRQLCTHLRFVMLWQQASGWFDCLHAE